MPIYVFECESCQFTKEELVKLSESPVFKCEKCDKEMVKVISGGAMFDLKGDGFYKGGKDVSKK